MREWAAGQGLPEDLNSSLRGQVHRWTESSSPQREYLERQLPLRQEDRVWILSDVTLGGMTEFQGHSTGWIGLDKDFGWRGGADPP